MIKKLIILLSTLNLMQLHAQTPPNFQVKEAMIQDLNIVKYHMSIKYAPREWKEQYLGWDLEDAYEQAKAKIYQESHNTSKDYHKTLKRFLGSVRDYHVKTLFYSSEWALFPLAVKCVEDRYYISEIYPDLMFLLNDDLFPSASIATESKTIKSIQKIKIGDEVTAINGTPVKEAIETLIDEEFGGDRSETGYALAENTLFHRRAEYGEEVPNGSFELTVHHQGAFRPATYEFPWLHFPEWIMNKSFTEKDRFDMQPGSLIRRYSKKDFTVHYARGLQENLAKLTKGGKRPCKKGVINTEDYRIKGFLPELGEVIWENSPEQDFYAYLYRNTQGRKIGYLYLPTFHYEFDAEEVVGQIGEILKFFNQESDALVIDITDNPGGNLLFAYGVLSLLTDKPMSVPSHKELIIQKDVFDAALLSQLFEGLQEANLTGEITLDGYPADTSVFQGAVDYFQKIISFWEEGKTLTDPLYIYGIEAIKPHPNVRYTKPILLLINELGFSCSDFFAAILQDNDRATLFGNTTAGAGGYVLPYPHTSRFGVEAYHLTGSIAFRKNGTTPIENLGVSPDIPCKLTRKDMLYRYVDYRKAVNAAVDNLLR